MSSSQRLSLTMSILRCQRNTMPNPARKCRSAGQTQTGPIRADNQDAILIDETIGLWLVADGMGGHAGGAKASRLASTTVRGALQEGWPLRAAILEAHKAIRSQQSAHPELSDMGTTIVALVECGDEYEICWVGDSRAYLFDFCRGRLDLLTRDHNLAGLMVEAGTLSASEAARHPKRHILTNCLGLPSEAAPKVDQFTGQWKSGEILLLCSDGLSGELSDQVISSMLAAGQPLDIVADRLMDQAIQAGARDNVSLILVESPVVASPEGAPSVRSRWWRRV